MTEPSSQRDSFQSRLGFILVSAGCAIGIGNVWKFPYLCGQYGGAAFILLYLLFLLILGIPVLLCEFAMGRGGRRSVARCFDVLAPKGSRWPHLKHIGIAGVLILMLYYTTVTGWMLEYCWLHLKGTFVGQSPAFIQTTFKQMLAQPLTMGFWTFLSCLIGFVVCYMGLEKGIERITKVMMSALLLLMMVLAVHSVFLPGAEKGIEFYLVPNFPSLEKIGWGNVIYAAMSQAFFTLSAGNGAMMIFASYMDKKRSLPGEAITITALDTFVALMSGFIIIPACFAYGIQPDAGPSLIFLTIPNLFTLMPGGRIWGSLFFIFLSFAALSTVIAVMESIIACFRELFDWERPKAAWIVFVLIAVGSIPCVLGFNVWSGFQPLGPGTGVLDLEDFIVSNNLLPLGGLTFVLFCTRKNGWGWNNFLAEVNAGQGRNLPGFWKPYLTYGLPLLLLGVYLKGYEDMFIKQGPATLTHWLGIAAVFLVWIWYCVKPTKDKAE
ncbi:MULTISPECIES: sodium-dependent transporter [Acidaminococcus]|uniref:sodium-dependent transporter n=1 Tax=Acidaminococcus TaxID=904 RepID=UPI002599FC7D|nr:sodium-dependent transporter [Acidaminococcus sp.]MDO5597566.1 sodium-dependent transporter [Acidaminococcus sp.]